MLTLNGREEQLIKTSHTSGAKVQGSEPPLQLKAERRKGEDKLGHPPAGCPFLNRKQKFLTSYTAEQETMMKEIRNYRLPCREESEGDCSENENLQLREGAHPQMGVP